MRFVDTITLGHKKNVTINITDPCYAKDVWCRFNRTLPSGQYECEIDRVQGRVSVIRILSKPYNGSKLVGHIGVDAGLAGFFVNKPDFSNEAWHELCGKMFNDSEITTSEDNVYIYDGEDWKGFWSESGWGDGGYPVYELYYEGSPVGLEIEFIPEEEEEEDEF